MHGALIAVRSAGLYLAVLFFLFGETECNRANLNGSAICLEPSLKPVPLPGNSPASRDTA